MIHPVAANVGTRPLSGCIIDDQLRSDSYYYKTYIIELIRLGKCWLSLTACYCASCPEYCWLLYKLNAILGLCHKRYNLNLATLRHWIVSGRGPLGLSINGIHNVLVTCCANPPCLQGYTAHGSLVRTVKLLSGTFNKTLSYTLAQCNWGSCWTSMVCTTSWIDGPPVNCDMQIRFAMQAAMRYKRNDNRKIDTNARFWALFYVFLHLYFIFCIMMLSS